MEKGKKGLCDYSRVRQSEALLWPSLRQDVRVLLMNLGDLYLMLKLFQRWRCEHIFNYYECQLLRGMINCCQSKPGSPQTHEPAARRHFLPLPLTAVRYRRCRFLVNKQTGDEHVKERLRHMLFRVNQLRRQPTLLLSHCRLLILLLFGFFFPSVRSDASEAHAPSD